MSNLNLLCNFNKCSKYLTKWALVTKCYHIFCSEHEVGGSCPVCGQFLNDKLSVITVDLSPDESYKNMVLAGLNPEEIIDISNRAIRFWCYQIYHERIQNDQKIKHLNEREASLQEYCEVLKSNFQTKKQKFDRTVEDLQKELENVRSNEENYCKQISDKNRLISQLQSEIDLMRKQMLKKSLSKFVSNEIKENYVEQKPDYSLYRQSSFNGNIQDNKNTGVFRNERISSPFHRQQHSISPSQFSSSRLDNNRSPFRYHNEEYLNTRTGEEQQKESRWKLF